MTNNVCRFCGKPITETFADLGMSPLSNAYISCEQLFEKETFFPLHACVCTDCFLVQVIDAELPENIFSDYAYFSSYSDTWLKHSQEYAAMAIPRFGLSNRSLVVELASNDGYLLQYFKKAGIPVLGVEPAANVALEAKKKEIPTVVDFFGSRLARELANQDSKADLIIGNNVLAHVPDINDFVAGMEILLKEDGIITMEFPHLLKLMEERQFDTIYHEHFSYLSFCTSENVFNKYGLKIFDVEEMPTHGGSLRIYACRSDSNAYAVTDRIAMMKEKEEKFGLKEIAAYRTFAERVKALKRELLATLIYLKRQGAAIVGYGAPAKGNTLLNYCGIRTDFIDYTVDRSPHKQGKFLPGTHIPILHPDEIRKTQPDYVIILPWNLKAEIMEQLEYIRQWGGKFIVAIPTVEVL
ncbi:MAG: class I SAM-dependent methyltransferase [Clostridiaceae bacterium]|nr:class I SAM-dependent methyltransferase [Clostridiaceae bacterium]